MGQRVPGAIPGLLPVAFDPGLLAPGQRGRARFGRATEIHANQLPRAGDQFQRGILPRNGRRTGTGPAGAILRVSRPRERSRRHGHDQPDSRDRRVHGLFSRPSRRSDSHLRPANSARAVQSRVDKLGGTDASGDQCRVEDSDGQRSRAPDQVLQLGRRRSHGEKAQNARLLSQRTDRHRLCSHC